MGDSDLLEDAMQTEMVPSTQGPWCNERLTIALDTLDALPVPEVATPSRDERATSNGLPVPAAAARRIAELEEQLKAERETYETLGLKHLAARLRETYPTATTLVLARDEDDEERFVPVKIDDAEGWNQEEYEGDIAGLRLWDGGPAAGELTRRLTPDGVREQVIDWREGPGYSDEYFIDLAKIDALPTPTGD
ncbi:hypothetical protein V6N00_13765 [Tersicoccus sp. MR15.9]|uniref:hypothetical protein n=1 Tax=Tersicoccus mangrovi TaxID=3121635 RepID=UPI002FE63B9F